MTARLVRIERAGRQDTIDLDRYAAGDLVERSRLSANAWIKGLRHAQVDGQTFRDRFTYRGDSLWWFAELFLHKEAVVDRLWRTALALDALIAREQPAAIGAATGDRVLATLLPQAARRHDVRILDGPAPRRESGQGLRSRALTWSARASRWLPHGALPALDPGGALVFVHSAFWRPGAAPAHAAGADWEGEEGYIGPVLNELAAASEPIRLVGVGPRTNFRARRWWHPLVPWRRATPGGGAILPVEQFASSRDLAGSTDVWRNRDAIVASLLASEDLRARSRVDGYDVWAIVAGELIGVATLQFPWSARAMDEAAAALERCAPSLVITYAEAGGWGRAIVLEARRRGIPSVGLQHGFIYRHWLNYRHEPDEMRPSPANAADAGFPRPTVTFVHDGFAAEHLATAGQFPGESVQVTGSPGLDRLAAALAEIGPDARVSIRRRLDLGPGTRLAVLVTKRSQIGRSLGALVTAVERTPGLRLVVKPHPAETAEAYAADLDGHPSSGLAPPSLDLAALLAAADLIVTVNSTVAIDATVLGIPALAVGLPNNLTPLVERGVLAGVQAASAGEADALARELGDVIANADRREALVQSGRAFAARYGIAPDGSSARRTAAAIRTLASSPGLSRT